MSKAIFFRLIDIGDKGHALQEMTKALPQANIKDRFVADPDLFSQVPGSPFAYWANEEILSIFGRESIFENDSRVARQGLSTADDFRFAALWWEVSLNGDGWFCFAKGGAFSKLYFDFHLVINWGVDGSQLKAWAGSLYDNSHWSRIIKNVEWYFHPGLTWTRRTSSRLSMRVMPSGSIFADKGPAIFFLNDTVNHLLATLSLVNSSSFRMLIAIQLAAADAAARSYEVGLVQRTPFPELTIELTNTLANLASSAWSLKRNLDTTTQTSHAFLLPALLQTKGITLADRAKVWITNIISTEQQLSNIQKEIDNIAFELYGINPEEINSNEQSKASNAKTEEEETIGAVSFYSLTHSLLEYILGVALGRFDIRLATGECEYPSEPEPFDPLPVCSPGMLVAGDNLPPTSTEELSPNYPINISFDGILVDDESNQNDIIRCIRPVFDIIFAEQSGDIEQETCQLLKTASLRDYFAKPNAFFTQHLSRYSKSRRYAPIYLPLSTVSGSYTLWIYYHRLTDQTLYTCINNYIEPKLTQTSRSATQLLAKTTRTNDDDTYLENLQTLEQELTELRDELLHVAQLPYQPNLNDGVQITAAPLWKCFRLKKWQTKLESTWKQLEKGDYDWAHLAYSIWPERVAEKCKQDKSLAIAHNLENLYEAPPEKTKKQRKRSSKRSSKRS